MRLSPTDARNDLVFEEAANPLLSHEVIPKADADLAA